MRSVVILQSPKFLVPDLNLLGARGAFLNFLGLFRETSDDCFGGSTGSDFSISCDSPTGLEVGIACSVQMEQEALECDRP